MSETCPKCGAPFASETECREQFDIGQIKEGEEPERYAVHHLSVPCYMLQHNIYTREYWPQVRELLRKFVYEGLSPAEARRRYQNQYDGGKRTGSITRGPKLTEVESIAWTFTVADVRLDTPEHYCADVREWAVHVLADSEALIKALKS